MVEGRWRFWREWRQYDSTKTLRDYATVHDHADFRVAADRHRVAQAGAWVTEMMVGPHVSALYEVRQGGSLREVRGRGKRDVPAAA